MTASHVSYGLAYVHPGWRGHVIFGAKPEPTLGPATPRVDLRSKDFVRNWTKSNRELSLPLASPLLPSTTTWQNPHATVVTSIESRASIRRGREAPLRSPWPRQPSRPSPHVIAIPLSERKTLKFAPQLALNKSRLKARVRNWLRAIIFAFGSKRSSYFRHLMSPN